MRLVHLKTGHFGEKIDLLYVIVSYHHNPYRSITELSVVWYFNGHTYSSGHYFLEVLGSLSHSKLMVLFGHDATDKIN